MLQGDEDGDHLPFVFRLVDVDAVFVVDGEHFLADHGDHRFVGVVQLIQDTFLVPKIMGSAMGLNPAVILLSLSVWGSLLGFIGLIIALPLTTLLISYYKRFVLEEKETI